MKLKAELRKLPNGLRVVLAPCEAQSIAFGLFVASGSRHETEKTAGISHFIEHMLFKGTPKRTPLEITQAIEGRGGNFNACTGEESTCYFTHMPFEYLDEAVDILSDMYLNASIPAEEFAREKQVVIEEIKMYADEPDSVAMENLQRAVFPKSRLGSPVAGSAKSLTPLTPADMKRYIRSHYLPSNTIAVLVGAFDPEKALKAVASRLGTFRRRGRVSVSAKEDLAAKPVASVSVDRDVQQTQLAIGYRTFGIADQRKYAAAVFDAVMGRGMSSRLFQEVREKRGLSYDISSRMQLFDGAGMWTIAAGIDSAKAQSALRVIDRELRRIRGKRVSAAELERVKEFLVGNFRLSHEKVISKMFFYGQTVMTFNRIVEPEEQVEGVKNVTSDDVIDVARTILADSNRSVSWVTPRSK